MTETTGSTATPESGNPEGADGAGENTPAEGEALSRRDRKRAKRSGDKSGKRAKKGLFARIGLFYRQIIAELRKVVWPTRGELTSYTTVVVTFVVVMMALVAGLDYGFSKLSLLVFG
ncbi:preprotein translocase subunit SecE [Streptomyces sp. SP17BM10]|uniref:preprotein translocase subunit SecE n=1 Tax=Streptomyces sp. SP17BM10 TaxID=3002530 RepID=UPI002E787CCE|nr:preprotein translocase subunit SecE [Streptomyces sp. SP17BM10]MEE1787165.1 preprotein translocase subunit SecE [Streptomyces sp. SP17BM10]